MTCCNILIFKIISFILFLTVICSSNVWADLPLPMASDLTEAQEFLLTGDLVMLVGFLLWIAYIVFFFPKDLPKKL